MTLAPRSARTIRVLPTPCGGGEVQSTRWIARHQCSGQSPVRSDQTSAAGLGTSNVSARRTGALSKKLSSTGWVVNIGARTGATLPARRGRGSAVGAREQLARQCVGVVDEAVEQPQHVGGAGVRVVARAHALEAAPCDGVQLAAVHGEHAVEPGGEARHVARLAEEAVDAVLD